MTIDDYEFHDGPSGEAPPIDDDDYTGDDRDAEVVRLRPEVIESGTARFKRWSITELAASDLTYEWDATGLLMRPTYGVDTGELKTLKSYLAMSRAVGLAAGVPVLGHWRVPQRRRVLMYVAEGGRVPFVRRLHRIAAAHGVDLADLDGWLTVVFDAGPLDSAEFRDTLCGHLTEFAPHFVHLDPLYPFQPMTVDSNRINQVGAMLTEVHQLVAAHDATFWVTAHMNQSGQGFDLKRIAGAGVGEWGDSWVLLKHRETPDVAGGRFRLAASIGSRQWGGSTVSIDLNIGRFDPDQGTHDGPITFKVIHGIEQRDKVDPDEEKRMKARRGVLATVKRARVPLSKTEIEERSTGAASNYLRAALADLVDDETVVEADRRKPEKGGREVVLYELAEEWRNA